MTKLAAILDQIDSGSVLLPEFQRGYVWNRDQVRGLMRSLYRGYPVGGLLTWETQADGSLVRGEAATTPALRVLILDGQQRVTSLYGITRGRPPAFFQGDEKAFSGLRFNVEDETFEFYGPAKMRDDPRWIDVTSLFTRGLEHHIGALNAHPDTQPRIVAYMERLARLRGVLDRDFHEEKITGEDKTVDVVVDIFNRVNSGGTKLSKGDLALAKKCAHWPEARAAMRSHLDELAEGRVLLQPGLAAAQHHSRRDRPRGIRLTRRPARRRLQAGPGSVRQIRQPVPRCRRRPPRARPRPRADGQIRLPGDLPAPASRWWALRRFGGHVTARCSGTSTPRCGAGSPARPRPCSTRTTTRPPAPASSGLITSLERWRGGNLTIDGQDFEGFGRDRASTPCCTCSPGCTVPATSRSGLPLHSHLLGHLASLQVHHIFPKAVLYDAGYLRSQVNAVANFCFLTQDTNLAIGKRRPEDYFPEVETKHPGVLASQWIPEDPALWRIDRYPDFLAARRELLADAANAFLGALRTGTAPGAGEPLERQRVVVDAPDDQDSRNEEVTALIAELTELGCAEPAVDCEISDPATGRGAGHRRGVLARRPAARPGQPGRAGTRPGRIRPGPARGTGLRGLHLNRLAPRLCTPPQPGSSRTRGGTGGSAENADDPAAAPDAEPGLDVRAEFEQAMKDVYVRAKSEANYTATYFVGMLSNYGGLGTAQRLLASTEVSTGFATLYERGRLDLTVEALVIQPKFASLFTDEEIDIARQRLDQLGYR